MKVVWVSHSGLLLGAERSLMEGVKGLMATGVELHAVVPSDAGLANRMRNMKVPVSVIPFSWWMSPKGRRSPAHRLLHLYRNLRAWRRLTKLLKQYRPDLVVTNTLVIPFGAMAAKSAGVAHVWYIHELASNDHGLYFDFGESLSFYLINKLSDRVIVNSSAVREKFSKHIAEDKMRLIFYAVETPAMIQQATRDDADFSLVIVGALAQGKRQEDAVRAVSILARKGIKTRLDIVGGGGNDYERYLRRLVKELGVEESIRFIDFTESPFSYYASADVALMCSRNEAFGRVTVEAMKMGRPVIGANSGGTPDLITDGWNGLLYKPGSAEELAEKIELLYYDREMLREMGENAYEWSNQTFNLQKYASNLLSVFQESVGARAKQVTEGEAQSI